MSKKKWIKAYKHADGGELLSDGKGFRHLSIYHSRDESLEDLVRRGVASKMTDREFRYAATMLIHFLDSARAGMTPEAYRLAWSKDIVAGRQKSESEMRFARRVERALALLAKQRAGQPR